MKQKYFIIVVLLNFLLCTSQVKVNQKKALVLANKSNTAQKNTIIGALNSTLQKSVLSSELTLTSSNYCASLMTNYSDASNSFNTQDPIFLYESLNAGNLTCPLGSGSATYDWYKFNSTTNSYDAYF